MASIAFAVEPARWNDYFTVHVAILARGGTNAAAAVARIRRAGESVGLTAADLAAIVASATSEQPVPIAAAVTRLRDCELRFTLIADCLQIAHFHGLEVPAEAEPIRRLASALLVAPAQLSAIAAFIATCQRVATNHTWIDPAITALRAALAAIDASGASAQAASGGPHPGGMPMSFGGIPYAGLERLATQLFRPDDSSQLG